MAINSPRAQLTIRSRKIHTPEGWRDGTVVVYNGKVAGVVEPGLAPDAERHIDAGDKPVIPGVIDTHVHVRDPGFTQKDDWFSTLTGSGVLTKSVPHMFFRSGINNYSLELQIRYD